MVDSIVFGTTISQEPVDSGEADEILSAGYCVDSGRFKLVRPLGQGAMGVVWLADDLKLNHPVALKFLSPRIRENPLALQRQREELLHARRLRHTNIVSLFDWHDAGDGIPFISMEYVDGETLSQYRRRKPLQVLTWNQLQPLILQLGEALKYAHEREHILHRDIKPGNLMLSSDGTLKVADFGLAQLFLPNDESRLATHGKEGTLLYMSPQQYQGLPSTPTDDVYSLGSTLYELLSGTPPFYPDEIEQELLTYRAQPLSDRLAALEISNPVPTKARVLIGSCLEKDPRLRPQSVREFLSRLPPADAQLEQVAGPAAPRETWTNAVEPPARTNRLLALLRVVSNLVLIAGLAVGVLLVTGLIPSLFSRRNLERPTALDGQPAEPGAATALSTDFKVHSESAPVPDQAASVGTGAESGSLSFQLLSGDPNWKRFSFSLFDSAGKLVLADRPLQAGETIALTNQAVDTYKLVIRVTGVDSTIRTNLSVSRTNSAPTLLLYPPWSFVSITSEPQGAVVQVDQPVEWPAQLTPLHSVPVRPGNRSFRLSLAGFLTSTHAVEVLPRVRQNPQLVHVRLKPRLQPPKDARVWTNSLGMELRRLAGGNVLMATTEVTREQFSQFARHADPALAPGMYCLGASGWTFIPARSWEDPGFPQEDTHPVIGVSWEEAARFCEWLTRIEREQQWLAPDQGYLLPADNDYDLAIWGERREPPEAHLLRWPWQEEDFRSKINFAGQEVSRSPHPWPWDPRFSTRQNAYNDGFVRTAPVVFPGDFNPQNGLFGLAGNVAEWCLDPYTPSLNPPEIRAADPEFFQTDGPDSRMVRGGSWFDHDDIDLSPHTRRPMPASARHDHIGFRVVLHLVTLPRSP
ncbi:MAG: SUMF1/EgtB/PvdO family nonheme iron enzyme [Verrucomicrobia bacterium]|nr:SUMF1/EgtB/PvdO family nonheme iron enzyme [Verrucomicrobiota bacterium]